MGRDWLMQDLVQHIKEFLTPKRNRWPAKYFKQAFKLFILEDGGTEDDFSSLVCAPGSLVVLFTKVGNNGQSPDPGRVREENHAFSFGHVEFEMPLKYPEGDAK